MSTCDIHRPFNALSRKSSKVFQRSYPLLFWWKMNGGVSWHFHLCGNRNTTHVKYKMESVLKSQKKNLGSQNIWKKNKYGTTFCHSEKKTTHSYGTLSPQGGAMSDAFQLMCPCVFSFSTHGAWVFHLQSLHKENTLLSLVCKCKQGVFKFMWATFKYRTTNSVELKMKNVLLKTILLLKVWGSPPSTLTLQKNFINCAQKDSYPSGTKDKTLQPETTVLYWCSLLPFVLIFEPFNTETESDVSE